MKILRPLINQFELQLAILYILVASIAHVGELAYHVVLCGFNFEAGGAVYTKLPSRSARFNHIVHLLLQARSFPTIGLVTVLRCGYPNSPQASGLSSLRGPAIFEDIRSIFSSLSPQVPINRAASPAHQAPSISPPTSPSKMDSAPPPLH